MQYYQKAVYKTNRWKYVRKQVIERDRNICYFCKRLVLKKPTIHHINEIDEKNYSDENIAFNLNNLVLCHPDCHNIHHERFGYKESIVNDDLEIDYKKRKEKDEIKNTFHKV